MIREANEQYCVEALAMTRYFFCTTIKLMDIRGSHFVPLILFNFLAIIT